MQDKGKDKEQTVIEPARKSAEETGSTNVQEDSRENDNHTTTNQIKAKDPSKPLYAKRKRKVLEQEEQKKVNVAGEDEEEDATNGDASESTHVQTEIQTPTKRSVRQTRNKRRR